MASLYYSERGNAIRFVPLNSGEKPGHWNMVLPVGGTTCSVVISTYIYVTAIAGDVIISVITSTCNVL